MRNIKECNMCENTKCKALNKGRTIAKYGKHFPLFPVKVISTQISIEDCGVRKYLTDPSNRREDGTLKKQRI